MKNILAKVASCPLRGWLGLVVVCVGLTEKGAAESEILLEERFEQGALPDSWWVEGGERVWVEDGRLQVQADPTERHGAGYVCTIWQRIPISGDVQIDMEAHVLSSSREANNINAFVFYADPTGQPLQMTRGERAEAHYASYHELDGYIFTFINAGQNTPGDTRARIRMRRCPGFEFLAETFDYHCQPGRTYHLRITRRGDTLSLAIDGRVFLEVIDPNSHHEGLFGLRTYHTRLWWDNIVITRLGS